MDEEAVSEVIGTLILVGVVVTGIGLVGILLLSNPTPSKVPVFDSIISNRSKTIYIYHKGGDPLWAGQYKILVDGGDQTANFTISGGTDPWSVGETLTAIAPSMPRRVVILLNQSGGGASILAVQDLYPNISVPAPSDIMWYNYPSTGKCYWQYRKSITIDGSKVPATLSNFPVLVSLPSDGGLSGSAQANGNDILFTNSAGTTKLDHEIESYTASTGALIAWVNVPTVTSGTNTVIYMYYGNSTVASQQNPTGVWDANYKGVWHLKESCTGAPGEFKDSTQNVINGRGGAAGACPTLISNGAIGGAQSFDGSNDNISMGTSTLLQPSELTFSYWISRTGSWNGLQRRFFWAQGALQATHGWYVDFTDSTGQNRPLNLATDHAGWLAPVMAPDTYYSLNTWTYMVVTYSTTANVAQSYKNAVSQGMTSWGTMPTSITSTSDPKYVAMSRDPAVNYVQGNFDELRISNIVRSPAWIATEYANQNSPSTFSSVGSEEQWWKC